MADIQRAVVTAKALLPLKEKIMSGELMLVPVHLDAGLRCKGLQDGIDLRHVGSSAIARHGSDAKVAEVQHEVGQLLLLALQARVQRLGLDRTSGVDVHPRLLVLRPRGHTGAGQAWRCARL